jgi:hypothetical protein
MASNNLPETKHLVGWIDAEISEAEFLQRLDAKDERFVLAGLHACGDLSPTLLKLFANCPTACGVISVGCCYMKMSTK